MTKRSEIRWENEMRLKNPILDPDYFIRGQPMVFALFHDFDHDLKTMRHNSNAIDPKLSDRLYDLTDPNYRATYKLEIKSADEDCYKNHLLSSQT